MIAIDHFVFFVKAGTVLEIGMFTGTTTVSLALLPSVKKVVSLELEGYLKVNNTPYFEKAGVAHKIDVRIGDALTSLDTLIKEGATFDMVRFSQLPSPWSLQHGHAPTLILRRCH